MSNTESADPNEHRFVTLPARFVIFVTLLTWFVFIAADARFNNIQAIRIHNSPNLIHSSQLSCQQINDNETCDVFINSKLLRIETSLITPEAFCNATYDGKHAACTRTRVKDSYDARNFGVQISHAVLTQFVNDGGIIEHSWRSHLLMQKEYVLLSWMFRLFAAASLLAVFVVPAWVYRHETMPRPSQALASKLTIRAALIAVGLLMFVTLYGFIPGEYIYTLADDPRPLMFAVGVLSLSTLAAVTLLAPRQHHIPATATIGRIQMVGLKLMLAVALLFSSYTITTFFLLGLNFID